MLYVFAQENGKEFGLHKWAKVRSDGMQSSQRMRMQQVKVFSQQVTIVTGSYISRFLFTRAGGGMVLKESLKLGNVFLSFLESFVDLDTLYIG